MTAPFAPDTRLSRISAFSRSREKSGSAAASALSSRQPPLASSITALMLEAPGTIVHDVRMTVRISRSLHAQILAEARGKPTEICGFLLGFEGRIEGLRAA